VAGDGGAEATGDETLVENWADLDTHKGPSHDEVLDGREEGEEPRQATPAY
jgi:hypothetical protein